MNLARHGRDFLSSLTVRVTPATKKKIGIGLGVVAALLAVALTVFLLKRQALLTYALGQVKAKVERKYPVTLTLGEARFTNLKTVGIAGMSLVPKATPTDTLLQARSMTVSLSVRSLFAGRPVFSNLEISDARLTAHKTAQSDNYSFLYKKKGSAPTVPRDTTKGTNYGLLINQLLEASFDNVPGEADFRNFLVTYDGPRHQARIVMPRLSIEDGDIQGELTAVVDSVENRVGVQGHIEPGDYALNAEVFGLGRRHVTLPYVQRRYGAKVQFDTLRFSLSDKDFSDEELTVRGTASAANFIVNHPRLSDRDVRFPRGGIDFVARVGQAFASLDEGTKVTLNRMAFFPVVSVRKLPLNQRVVGKMINGLRNRRESLAGVQVKADIVSAETPANTFFAALPENMFNTLTGMQGEGTLKYRMHLDLDMNQLDSLEFSSGLTPKNFRIIRMGREDLNKLNEDFLYTAYNDKGDSVKAFTVGPSNPEFAAYDEVSNYLKSAIMTAEDPRFLSHKGFMEKAFVKSAIQNIKEKRFARGGSTISMQLVKNVFLTRQKTVTRKIEEALIVWLLENTRLVSKQRMFEVYLNIIEWGPRIYGVTEASEFYFDKSPGNLNLSESLYLASIIPRPKYYQRSFNQYGEMRSSARYFHRLIAKLMASKGLISQGDYESVDYSLNFPGRAHNSIFRAVRDTVRATQPSDSTEFEPLNLLDLLGGNNAPDGGVNTNIPAEQGGGGTPNPAPKP
ncbi:transglycosylase domain-containing protein [Hymenobacter tibetensis]|uniref:Transglycosylase domain-containing protein n=1 Tax=Hymenobacter tibetensis TaxID=497967 RepID=A0ABY4CWW7_9BACT|nr:biosynthetic peptidoglycan transglycosylase [Hymenobacter tibetensis]UOG73680.1 transglycosylase domain-containing protein [Hymenobacter tibetensis]